jgi:acyl-CoA thioesterase-1
MLSLGEDAMSLWFSTIFIACCILLGSGAATAQVVALGADDTYGVGVGGPSGAYPAKLQAALKARGYNLTVTNAGIKGNTTSAMLARVDSAVPPETKIVILGACEGLDNNCKQGVSEAQGEADIDSIEDRLKARGIRVIFVCEVSPVLPRAPDNVHLSPIGQAMLASTLLSQVIYELGQQ